ncbi:MAG: RNA-binding transcriptional accessory protein [Mogibacterium sp.]|nr:RNA-binding transcriptional accessory protein [Mogibacterium sp.]
MDIIRIISQELDIKPWQADAVIGLIDEGNTIPFIARYRKEATGALDDETLRNFEERLKYLRNLEDRKRTVLASIEEQGKLTEELRRQIEEAMTAVAVEDLYRPYKPKRRTRAMIAKEKGLDGLADYLLAHPSAPAEDVSREAEKYFSEEHEVTDAATAVQLAQDILAGDISDNAAYRARIREMTRDHGVIVSKAAGDPEEKTVYENYYDYREPVAKIPGHRVLALNRGEKEKILTVSLEVPEDRVLGYLAKQVGTGVWLDPAVADAYRRLIAPSIETEIRNELTEAAQEGAIKVFGSNLEQLLMQPPMQGKTVLGWDPAFRTGCKLAVCDPTGKILETTVIYPTPPQNKVEEARKVLAQLVRKYDIDIISVGNGTASRESERIIADFIRDFRQRGGKKLEYVIVNEAGASVYSASKLATEEYPDLDVGERSSASIARRLQDPLAELVKIDPKAIGVGQYQHDMNQKRLGEALGTVVEDCVNRVGVDLNTASPSLLEYVSGVSKPVAANIVRYRDANGRFRNRRELLKVPKLGPKAFEQCAGFLRIRDGSEPLDATAVHPESYDAARKVLVQLGYTEADLAGGVKDLAVKLAGRTGGKPSGGAGSGAKQARGKGSQAGKPGAIKGFAALAALNEEKKREEREEKNRKKALQKPGAWKGSPAVPALAKELGIGEYTLKDILTELEKPGRDPREEAAAPILRSDVLELTDLRPGMELKGTVRNIVDFGCFVDIGVHQDGLVHISELSDRYVEHPLDVVKVGDIVTVWVLSVDTDRKKISLSMKKQ